MLGKKPKSKADEKDYTELNAAVSELSKQTEALLGSTTKEKTAAKKSKPTSKQPAKVRSFDVIPHKSTHRTAKKTAVTKRVPSTLTSQPVPVELEAVEPDTKQETMDTTTDTVDSPAIVSHTAGTLQPLETASTTEAEDPVIVPSEEESEKISEKKDMPEPATSAKQLAFDDESEKEPVIPAEPSFSSAAEDDEKTDTSDKTIEPGSNEPTKEPITNEEKPPKEKAVPKQEVNNLPAQEKSSTKTASTEQSDSANEEEILQTDEHSKSAVYANNIAKDALPKDYEKSIEQQRPTVFDTKEYHAELHDWSKLDKTNRWAWYILVLLLIVAGGLAYIIILGKNIPYIM